ncbi:helix-turn-helix domain-containing protein [Streptomyces sp. NPDC102381]|uniref:helix-turn-helix domain-containing protein n=1 Tax=Streptomyces sp. NPDC102381 TaxID=3366164 RepID=UPI0038047F27
MLEQPLFGRRLRQLRTERGLTLAALAGEGMSAGYLSRLESGARRPTDRAVAHLADRLGISSAELSESAATSLAETLALTIGLSLDESGAKLSTALDSARGEDPLLRWQALWRVAEWHRHHGDFTEQRSRLEEMVELGTRIRLPELQARTLTALSHCARNMGEIDEAVQLATIAYELTTDTNLPTRVRIQALLTLTSSAAEAGHTTDAAHCADELLAATESTTGTQRAEALRTAADIHVLQGELAAAATLLDQAVAAFDGRDDPTLWIRLRIAAARLDLMAEPPRIAAARQRVTEAGSALPFGGTAAVERQLMYVRAWIATLSEDAAGAREALEELTPMEGGPEGRRVGPTDPADLLSHQDRIRLDVLRNRVLLLEGERDTAVAGLRELAAKAQHSGDMSLAAEIWRLVAETLAG